MSDIETSKGVYLSTYGCQMNVLDSELVRGKLESLGYHLVESSAEAGVVLLNTCSVRELSEHKVWSALGRLAIEKERGREDLVVGVLGCMAEREGDGIFKRAPQVDLICGPSNLDELPLLLESARLEKKSQTALSGYKDRRSKASASTEMDSLEALDLSRNVSLDNRTSSTQAYVRITRGCNKFCSFCVVPFTRGPEVHRPPLHIIDEVKRLVDTGVLEVTLLGQTVNHYDYMQGGSRTSFAELLWQIHEAVPELLRLRFITSYPRDFTDEALDVMAEAPRICRYLHIPAQSGSNAMLKAMNRGYTVEEYVELLDRARERMPDIRLAGDMIVGFPGESDEDHQLSVQLLRRAQYKSCFIFKYSQRPGTVAERRFGDPIGEAVKKVRNQELLSVQHEISLKHHKAYEGRILDVLVEGESKLRTSVSSDGFVQLGAMGTERIRLVGRTEGDEIVVFDGPRGLIGGMARVCATGATNLTIQGRLVGRDVPPEFAPAVRFS